MRSTLVVVLSMLAAAPVLAQEEAAVTARIGEFAAAWNRHDVKGMVATFAEDSDLISPFGRWAKGRKYVEALFQDDHQTVMKESTYTLMRSEVRLLGPTYAISDWECEITNMRGPQGETLPPFKHHVTVVHAKRDGQWFALAARPYAFVPAPAPAR